MLNENLQRKLILVGLAVLMAWAFFIRQQSILHSEKRSIDEFVYHRMAVQVQWGWENYHTIPYGVKLAASGRELPPYFFRPLYKHPPLFTMFNMLSYRIFGITKISPFYVALVSGILLIPLTYLIGALVFGRVTGFAAATVMTFDPIGIMVSQKVWMDPMIGLFIVASVYALILAVQQGSNRNFITSGILSGFGALTKYTGALGSVVAFAYALFFDRRLFRNWFFLFGLFIPVLMLIPWLVWNLQVYGGDFFGMQASLHSSGLHEMNFKRNLLIMGLVTAGGVVFFFTYYPQLKLRREFWINIRIAAGGVAVLVLWESILKSFAIGHLPKVSWAGVSFYESSHTFYFNRLLEWNLIFFFAMFSFFLPNKDRSSGDIILRLGFGVVLIVFTAWGAFQSRYIIAAVPLGIILGTELLVDVFRKVNRSESQLLRIAGRSAVFIIGYMVIFRMMHINYWISHTNDMCYF